MITTTLAAVLLCAAECGAAPVGDTVAYRVAPVLEDGRLVALEVSIRFAGSLTGETLLRLPDSWAGSEGLWRHVHGLAVTGARVVPGPDSARRVLRHPPAAVLGVRYRVRSAYVEEPGRTYEKARPLVLPDWFLFHGEGVFATVDGGGGRPASFAWDGLPGGWRTASDLDHLAAGGGTVDAVVQSVAMGAPDLEVARSGTGLRVARRGGWSFSPDAFAEAVDRIVRGADRLWEDPAGPFLVVLAPLGGGDGGVSMFGTGRDDAFSVASTPGVDLEQAMGFLAHEYLHTWFPPRLGGHLPRDEALGYWFSEGFTDAYAGRVLLAAGLWSVDDYATYVNRALRRYASSPARDVTGADVLARFWTDPAVGRVPYDRGHLLALVLDQQIRDVTGGRQDLHAVLLEQRRRVREGAPRPATDLFAEVLRERTGIDAAALVARHAHAGEPLLLPPALAYGCLAVRSVTEPAYDRGFEVEAHPDGGPMVARVDPAHPAHAAGLRPGMRVVRREAGVTGESTVEAAYRIVDDSGERVIRFLPGGRDQVTFQRVEPIAHGCAPSAAPTRP